MNFKERLVLTRESTAAFIANLANRFLPDLMPPPERGDHKHASVLLERGRKHYNRKDYEKAIEYFRKAVLADEAYVRAHYLLGLALYKRDDTEAAIRSWKRAVQIHSVDPFAMKAERKLIYVKDHTNRAVSELEERFRNKSK